MSTPAAEERQTPRPWAWTRRNTLPAVVDCRSKRTCIFALLVTEPIWAEKTAKRSSGAEPVWQASRPARVGTVWACAVAGSRTTRRTVQAILRTAPEEQHRGGGFSPLHPP